VTARCWRRVAIGLCVLALCVGLQFIALLIWQPDAMLLRGRPFGIVLSMLSLLAWLAGERYRAAARREPWPPPRDR
jgi:hypothetical protein